MIAVASAPPSAGSVPVPTSSSSTSAGTCSARSIAAMLVMCAEKVLRLAEIDCSSPMSANSVRNTGSVEPAAAGMCSPAWAISASSPAVFSATVLPPVFGPVMSSTRAGGQQHDVHRDRRRRAALGGVLEAIDHGLDEQRMAGFAQLDVSGRGQQRLHGVHHVGEPGPRLQQIELLGDGEAHPEVAGAVAEPIGERQQDAEDLLGLLLLERHDVVVDLDGGHRLEEQAGAAGRGAVDDARNRRLVLGPHHDHEPAVTAGDHLFLQILRRVAAPGELLERGAQLGPLPAQPLANRGERRAGLVHDLAVDVDGATHRRDLVDERGEAADQPLQDREASRRPRHRRPGPRRSRRRSRRGCAAAAPRAAGPRPPGRRARASRPAPARSGKTPCCST